ncbi:hypothetical protein CHUAL_007779 [Chamberlinius hualienensis]
MIISTLQMVTLRLKPQGKMNYRQFHRLVINCSLVLTCYLWMANGFILGGVSASWFHIPEGTKWEMTHAFTIPLSTLTEITVNVPLTYTFNSTASEERSLSDEQLDIFSTIEDTLQSVGLDGKSCLLRAICEINENPYRDFTLIGEVIMLLLRPRHRVESRGFLYDYYKAEDVGRRRGKCWQTYYKCPLSIKYFLASLRYKG